MGSRGRVPRRSPIGPQYQAMPGLASRSSPRHFSVSAASPFHDGSVSVTGPELRQLRGDLGDAIGRSLSAADMATLCGLAPGDGADTIRRWEVTGPSGPAAELLRILAMASDRHPILENRSEERRVGKECRSRWSPY